MALTAKITSKGQIPLPKEVRKLLNVKEGKEYYVRQVTDNGKKFLYFHTKRFEF